MIRRLLVLNVLLVMLVNASASDTEISASWPDIEGKVHTLSQYRGKWVIVNYWATTCPPCRKEIPELSKFHSKHKDHDAVVLGVDYEDIPRAWLREFLRATPASYPVLRTRPSLPTPFGPITVLPTTFVVSPDGRFMGRQVGSITEQALEHYLDSQVHAVKVP